MGRPGLILLILALLGLSVSGLIAARTYGHEVEIEWGTLSRSIDTHARLVQERLSERELLTRIAAGLIRSSSPLEPNALKALRNSIYAFKSDFVIASWIAQFKADDVQQAKQVLNGAGSRLDIRDFDDKPLTIQPPERALSILMDVEPHTDQTVQLLGRVLNDAPAVGPVLTAAESSRSPAASVPFALPRTDGSIGIVLAAPAFADSAATPVGFVTFSYRLAPLMLANDAASPFRVALNDPRDETKELVVDNIGRLQAIPASHPALRTNQAVLFGGRQWTLAYYPKVDPASRARSVAALVFGYGSIITAVVCALFGYVAAGNMRLSREIQSRISFEARLGSAIAELNHRVKNILAVTQSIVTRTIRPGVDIEDARDLLIGRIHAMSHVVSLLSDSSWQGARLRSLLDTRAIPHHASIIATGPEIVVSSRAAQNLSLAFFELASHAAPEAITNRPLHIVVGWYASGGGEDEVFHLRWEEFNATPSTRRRDNDFGITLLDRVTPEAIGGTARRYFTDVSYVYELTAPMKAIIDHAEMNRTLEWAHPSKN